MSYRIEVKNSSYQKQLIVAFGLLLIVSVWSVQQNLLTAIPALTNNFSINSLGNLQLLLQLIISLLVLAFILRQLALLSDKPGVVIQLKQNGDLLLGNGTQLSIDNKSLIASFFCWLSLVDKITGKQQYFIIYRDSVSEQEFRRICRIANQKKAPK